VTAYLKSLPTAAEERAIIRAVRRIVEFAVVRRKAWQEAKQMGSTVQAVHHIAYLSYVDAAKIAAEPLIMRRFR
jgi:hypothetical protein